ncbi:hypothetical protein GQ55_9G060700 [Panicum hallii var. hallii]|uniref:Uncharacterized protein n=1 Tax=Panicum hallii var. hallii TaxID=1504633 RepID=A0A2T7C060_9POAL|nr:hypothetical protein GQ55_9G060700 [Panicum hallii var. hallii]
MARLAVLATALLLLVVAEAILLPVHSARPLGSVELVAVREASSSSVAKPPSLRVPALIPFDRRYVEEADGPAAASYLVTDCTHKTPANGS